MISLVEWIAIIKAALEFPNTILRIVQLLQKTPQENHEALLQAAEAEALKIKQTGRPVWDS